MGQRFSILAAVVTTGLSAGLVAAFAYMIMPGLGNSDDATFVTAMQDINATVDSAWFAIVFFGPLLLIALALLLALRSGPEVWAWLLAGLLLYLAMLVITVAIHVPLTEDLDAAGPAAQVADLASVRDDFESDWVAWNVVRTMLTSLAFASVAWAGIGPRRRQPSVA